MAMFSDDWASAFSWMGVASPTVADKPPLTDHDFDSEVNALNSDSSQTSNVPIPPPTSRIHKPETHEEHNNTS